MGIKILCFAVLVAGILCLMKMKIYLRLYYLHRSSVDQITVSISSLWNLLSYRRTISTLDIGQCYKLQWVISKLQQRRKSVKTQSSPAFKPFWRMFNWYRKQYWILVHKSLSGILCERLVWRTRCGSDDAATTAVMSGVLWAIQTEIARFLKQRLIFVQQPRLEVKPVFCHTQFVTEFEFLVSVRMGNAIMAWVHLFPIIYRDRRE